MLTPIEIQGKVFKSGIGYDKKEVELYLKQIAADYESVYKENVELNDKINVLSEGIQYYKTIEKTLQKALVLAEKTAEETQNAAEEKAKTIISDANVKAKEIVFESKKELDRIHLQIMNMTTQYEKFRLQFKQLANTQLEILNSNAFDLKIADLSTYTDQASSEFATASEAQPVVEDVATEPVEVLKEEVKEAVKEEAVEEPVKPLTADEVNLIDHIELNPDIINFDEAPKKEEAKETVSNEYDMKEMKAEDTSSDFEFMDLDD
ncbi:cell division initiation protein DivIVA [Lachnospiraceae bacterium KM106-2]|nr:cell division initiation protein DivIVA [Lachnospiraceae bacterium KM106-2]